MSGPEPVVIARCLSGLKSPPESSPQLTASGVLVLESESVCCVDNWLFQRECSRLKPHTKLCYLKFNLFMRQVKLRSQIASDIL